MREQKPKSIIEPQLEDKLLDQTLRPSSFNDFVGQDKINLSSQGATMDKLV